MRFVNCGFLRRDKLICNENVLLWFCNGKILGTDCNFSLLTYFMQRICRGYRVVPPFAPYRRGPHQRIGCNHERCRQRSRRSPVRAAADKAKRSGWDGERVSVHLLDGIEPVHDSTHAVVLRLPRERCMTGLENVASLHSAGWCGSIGSAITSSRARSSQTAP